MSLEILDIKRKLQSFFADQKTIIGAWLYGSRTTHNVHELSDWDIGVLFSTMERSLERLSLLEDLRERLSKALAVPAARIQIVDIAQAPIPLAFEILQANVSLKGQNKLEVIVFENKIFSMYELDYHHHYQKYA